MRRNEIDELINIYEDQGFVELIAKLYKIQKQHKDIELYSLLLKYMHLTNKNNHSWFYSSNHEQIITNNNSSVIYFNKKLFDFKNINDRKIVVKESFKVDANEMMKILATFNLLCGNKVTSTNDVVFIGDKVVVTTKHNRAEFNKQEFELITKLLDSPSFNLADDNSYVYMQSANGYAYVLGKRCGIQNKF